MVLAAGPSGPPPSAAEGLPGLRVPVAAPPPTPSRPNAEIAEDILDLAFRLEDGREMPGLSRFEGPVRVRVAGPGPATLRPDLDRLVGRLRAEAGLDIAVAEAGEAEITVQAVPSAEIARAVPGAACFVVPGAASWDEFLWRRGTPALDWAGTEARDRAAVFVPADAAPQEIRDCLHEEVAQALGPLNDLGRLTDSVFNDDNVRGTLTRFDMLALRVLNAPELAPGLDRGGVAARLPALLARLNPEGERAGPSGPEMTLALGGLAPCGESPAPDHGAETARSDSHAGLGRCSRGPADPGAAFVAAACFAASPLTAIHAAQMRLRLAALALAEGDGDRVLDLTRDAIPVAEAHGDARLLATLLFLRAEALEARGDPSAEAVRLDGLGWARYGFGEAGAWERLAQVRDLGPSRREHGA